ncbi:hypothetical protein Hamer_G018797 [Homarus americanus]|uniref:Uncharacterized protein n=2 Tax=Homarus americanus TaxID=6706 RepID=A0A8J5JKE7_HOMAM|nr:hypothetical protein Hamer_G018797 [Homarus americanus]
MPGWRRRPRTAHRLLVLVLALGAVVIVVNLVAGDRNAAGTDHGHHDFLEGNEDWPPGYVQSQDLLHPPSKMTRDLAGPGVVVREVDEESLFDRILPGGGSPRTLITLDMTHPASPSLFCIKTRNEPQYSICPHNTPDDRYISEQLLREGTWETQIVSLFTTALTYYP